MGNKRNKFLAAGYSFISVWIIIFYFRFMSYLNHRDMLKDWLILLLFFVPAVFFEAFSQNIVLSEPDEGRSRKMWPQNADQWVLFSLKIAFWLFIYVGWVIVMPQFGDIKRWLDFFYFSLFPMLGMVYIAESYVTLIAVIAWLTIFYFTVVRRNILRIFSSLILPVLLTYILFSHFYHLGGPGAASIKRISNQKGVEMFYTQKDFPEKNSEDYMHWKKISKYARDIYVDEKQNAIYTNYANTYANKPHRNNKQSAVLRIDLDTKETHYINAPYTRAMGINASSLLISPVSGREIFELSKEDLSVERRFPIQVSVDYWEVIDIYHEQDTDSIFICNDMRPALLKYDYKTCRLTNILTFDGFKYGGTVWNIGFSKKRKKLYLTGFGGDADLFEIHPGTMKIAKELDLVRHGGSALVVDEEKSLVYFQDGGSNRLFEVDLERFEVKRVLKGEIHARRIFLDKWRNALYILSYFYGRLIAVDIETGDRLWTLKVGGKAYGLAVNKDILYVNSTAGIVKVDLNDVWDRWKHKIK
ncbi:MAG: hypothetical protein ABIH89_10410 [Elusimicrobiota bacterium]